MCKAILATLYGSVVSARNTLFNLGVLKIYHSKVPVISVGNLTAGGNGKTPLVIFLAQKLSARGYKPCIITRGYGGFEAGPYVVQSSDPSQKVGDEALLISLSTGVPVIVARKRVAGAKVVEEQKLGDIIILDDGFQHRWLGRSVDIISIDVSTAEVRDAFIAGKLLPEGMFREPRDLGLKRANTIVFADRRLEHKPQEPDARLVALIPDDSSVFRSYYSDLSIHGFLTDSKEPTKEIVLVSGIAHPASFEDSLRAKGFTIVNRYIFPDHHQFHSEEIQEISEKHPDLSIICTEKDAMRLQKFELRNWFYTRATPAVYPEDAFLSHVLKLARGQRAKT